MSLWTRAATRSRYGAEIDGADFRVWANRLVPSMGWGEAGIIGGEGAAGTARVAASPQNNAVAVWDAAGEMAEDIWANHFTPTGAWSGGERIEDNPGDAEAVEVGTDASGNTIALWRQQEGGRFDIWSNRYDAATGWGVAATIEANNAGNARFPRLAVAPRGNAIAVWGQSDGSRINIWANRFTSDMVWGNAVIIEKRDGSAALPDVGLASDGSAIAVWSQGTTLSNIWANRFTPSRQWGDAQLIETSDAGDASDAHVVVGPFGDAHAVWQQSDGTVTSIWSNSFTPANGWGEAQLIEDDDSGDADSLRAAGDPRGNIIAVWSQSDGTRRNIWANRSTTADGWGTPQLLEVGDAGDAVNPRVALDPGGRGVVVWSYFDGFRSSIWASRFE